MSLQQTEALAATIHELGYDSVESFALVKAREALQAEIELYQHEVAEYESKYGMDFQTFQTNFNVISTFGLFEKEDDKMEWNACLKGIELVENKLKTLSE
jgi:hypothetical protein